MHYNYDDYNDSELIMMIHESSEEANDILYKKYNYLINVTVSKYKWVVNKTSYDVSDLYQEALIGFIEGINKYREDKDSSLPSYLRMCILSKVQDFVRKIANKSDSVNVGNTSLNMELGDQELIQLIKGEDKDDPFEYIMYQDDKERLDRFIKCKLTETEYKIYGLLVSDCSYQEIADILHINVKAVDNAIQRIKRKIKSLNVDKYSCI
jgi:RNA polymerase sporulation-specific sigma factor